MLLANGFGLVVSALFLVGVLGVLVVSVALAIRLAQYLLQRRNSRVAGPSGPGLLPGGQFVCGEPRCGNTNSAEARYCSRCGRALQRSRDLDAYG